MAFVTSRGCRIHYRVSGAGPLLILQHGFFGSHANWKHFGYVDAFKAEFTVATVDSLAHGQSDSPLEWTRYGSRERAGDLVAVMDGLGHERAHVLGYSMGGWIGVGVARHYPERLASLSIGGWNCLDGMGPGLLAGAGKSRLKFAEYMDKARELSPPGSLAWVEGDTWIALSHCYEHLYDLDGSADAVAGLGVPVLLYGGQEDACHDPMKTFGSERGIDFLSLPGDHLSAMRVGASWLLPKLKLFAQRG